jgi:hypothetical protein
MNLLLWSLQAVAALLYGASGVMKVFLFDRVTADVPSFGALPRNVWIFLGIVELACTLGLLLPGALGWHPELTVGAASVLAAESLIFVAVHLKYRELPPIVFSLALGLLMAFVAYARTSLCPIP